MAITFDDGYKDFIINALPILAKFNLASNHNVVVNCVEGKQSIWTQELNTIFNSCKENNFDNPIKFKNHIIEFNGKYTDWKKIYLAALKYFFSVEKNERAEKLKILKELTKANYAGESFMNWSDLKKCSEQGVEIGSHSMTHDVLDTIADDKDLIFEIQSSKEIIESKLGTKVSTLAFPNGKNNLRAIKIAGECGYENILLTEERIYKFDKNSNNYPLLIPRMSVYDNGYYAEILRLENFQNTVKKIFRR